MVAESVVVYRKKSRLSSMFDDDLDERRRLFLERNRSVISRLTYLILPVCLCEVDRVGCC